MVIERLKTLNIILYRKLPLKMTGGIPWKDQMGRLARNSPMSFLTVAHDILYFEINDS